MERLAQGPMVVDRAARGKPECASRSLGRSGLIGLVLCLALVGCTRSAEPDTAEARRAPAGPEAAVYVPDPAFTERFEEVHREYLALFLASLGGIRDRDFGFLDQVVAPTMVGPSPSQTERIALADWRPDAEVVLDAGAGPALEASQGHHHRITFPVDWAADPLGSRTWRFRFQSLLWLKPYLKRAAKGDEQALLTACKIARDWITAHTRWPTNQRSFVFGDHSMAERVEILARLLRAYRASRYHDPEFSRLLVAGIWSHLALMMTAERYLAWHNHGIIFDRSMLRVLTELPEVTRRESMVGFVGQRAMEQLRFAFSTDGVHREHSPCYHGFVIGLFVQIVGLLQDNGIHIPAEAAARLDSTVRFATHVMKPDGSLPGIGDCTDGKPFRLDARTRAWLEQRSQGFRYGLSAGRHGRAPNESVAIFAQGGWALFRGSWERGTRDNVFAAIQADFNSFGHYQEDDTSFVLEVDGQRLVIDPGLNDYNKTPMSAYMRRARAHNVLLVDGRDFEFDLSLTGTSGITRSATLGEAPAFVRHALELSHAHYRRLGVEVHRQFARLEPGAFLVRDVIRASGDHRYQQVFHLAPGACVSRTGPDALRVSWPGQVHGLSILGHFDSFELFEGQRAPVQGWWFPRFGQPEPQPVLVLERAGRDLAFATYLVVQRKPAKVDRARLSALADPLIEALEAAPRRSLAVRLAPARWRF